MAKQWRIMNWLRNWWSSTDWLDKLLFFVLIVITGRSLKALDFGWQLRSGLDLLRTFHIPKFDPYAYTMPNHPWVNHEWLSEGIMAFIYKYLGAIPLTILFALIVIWAFWLAASYAKVDRKAKFIVIALAMITALGRWGVRLQMLTVLGTSIVLSSFWCYRQGEIKHLWWYVPLFLLWANLHGGFLMGLGILGLVWLIEAVKYWLSMHRPRIAKYWRDFEPTLQLKQLKHIFWVGLASGVVTLINPYGWKLYQDFYATFTNSFALQRISEWQPISILDTSGQWFLPYLVLWIFVVMFTYKKIEPTRLILTVALLILALISRRNLPFFLLISVGFLAEAINDWVILIYNHLINKYWLIISITIIGFAFTIPKLISLIDEAGDIVEISQLKKYPLQAVQWAKAHPDQLGSHMYNPYDWGGFLVWQFPEQKVFIDGRMSYWQLDNRFVFRDYRAIEEASPNALQVIQDKYGVDWALTSTRFTSGQILSKQSDWQLIYSDPIAVIYRKR